MRTLSMMGMAVLLLAMVTSSAVAQGPGGGGRGMGGDPQQFIDNNDTNKDGKVSSDEFQGPAQAFSRMDSNSDGFVTLEEVTAMRQERANRQGNQQQQGGGMGNAADFMQRRLEQIKESLGCTDDEWSVMQPRIEAVMTAQQSSMMRGMGMMRMGRRGQGGQGGPELPAEVQALQTVSEKQDASADELKSALKAYRDYAKKNEETLKAAREELRKLVTPRQEVILVLRGLLD